MKYLSQLLLILLIATASVFAHDGKDDEPPQTQVEIHQPTSSLTKTSSTVYALDLLLLLTAIILVGLRYRAISEKQGKRVALNQSIPFALITTIILATTFWAISYVMPQSEATNAVPKDLASNHLKVVDIDHITISKESQILFGIHTESATFDKLVRGITVTGIVRLPSQNRAEVTSPIAGLIKSMGNFTVGAYVKKGETLAVIEQILAAPEIAALEATRIDLSAKTAELEAQATQIRTKRNAAQVELARAQNLYEVGAIPLKRVQEVELQLKLAEEELEAAQLRAKITQVGEQKVNPTKTFSLSAPISGVISQSNFVAGSQAEVGKPLFVITNLDQVWVEAQVFEKDLAMVRAAKIGVFKTSAFPDLSLPIGAGSSNRLVTLGATVDAEKHTLPVIYEVTNPEGKLREGMSAEITFDTSDGQAVINIPKVALVDEQGQKVAYVYNGGEHFSRRLVKLGSEGATSFEVISGLEAGERIVVSGLYQIHSGGTVQ